MAKSSIAFKSWVIVPIGLNLILILLVLAGQSRLPPEVPLFYGLAQNESQLASALFLTLPNIISLAIMALNLVLIHFLKNDFLKKALLWVGIFTTILAAITVIRIALLVGSF